MTGPPLPDYGHQGTHHAVRNGPAGTTPRHPPEGNEATVPDAPGRSRAQASPAAIFRYLPVLIPAVAMLVAGIVGLARDGSMGNDEVATRWAALLSLHDLAHLLRHVDGVHGLYYLIMHAWVVLGSSPTVLRIPSVIAMIVGAGLLAELAYVLTRSGWAALLAGLIMTLTPAITYYAQTARSYALVFACVVAATLVLVLALSADGAGRRAGRWWAGYAVLIALGAYLNEMALLVLAAHAVTVAVARPGRRTAAHWLVAGACAVAVTVPLLALSVAERGAVSGLARPGAAAVQTLFRDYFGATAAASALLAVFAVVALLPSKEPAGRWWAGGVSLPSVALPSVALPLLVIPAFLLLAESAIGRPLYFDRYVLYGEAGAALLAGAGLRRAGQWLAGLRLAGLRDAGLRDGAPGSAWPASAWPASAWPGTAWPASAWPGTAWPVVAVPGVVICSLAVVLQLGPYAGVRTPGSRQFDFGGPSRYVGAHAKAGDGVLYMDTLFRKAELGYPADFRKVTDFAVAVPPRQAGNFRGTDKPFALIRPQMLGYQRIWVLGARPSAQLPEALERQESQLLLGQFTLVTSRHYHGITVTLWQRR